MKPAIQYFIEICSLQDYTDWAKLRKFDILILKGLQIGLANMESYESVRAEYPDEELKKAGLISDKGLTYINRLIIPYNQNYFAARNIRNRDAKNRNLFPKGRPKQAYFIPGKDDRCFILEGETDAIRLHHVFPESYKFSINGVKGYRLLNELPKKFKGKKIIFCYDNDAAGKQCLEDSMKILSKIKHNFEVYQCLFPEKYKDVDDYFFQENSAEDLEYIRLDEQSIYDKTEIENPIISLEEFLKKEIKPAEWLIENLIIEGGVNLIAGASGSYKTWIGMYIAMCLATGKTFLDKLPTLKKSVLYVDEENGERRLHTRFKNLKYGSGFSADNFSNLFISSYNNVKLDIDAKIKFLKGQIQLFNVDVVVIDCMVRVMEGSEDKSQDVRKIFDNLKPILKERNITFIVIHHITKRAKRGDIDSIRGSGDFQGQMDTIMLIHPVGKFANVYLPKIRDLEKEAIKEFTIIIDNILGKNVKLTYIEGTKENQSADEACAECLTDWFDMDCIVEFKSADGWEIAQKAKFKKNAFYKALQILCDEEEIVKLKRGLYKVKKPRIKEDNMELV